MNNPDDFFHFEINNTTAQSYYMLINGDQNNSEKGKHEMHARIAGAYIFQKI